MVNYFTPRNDIAFLSDYLLIPGLTAIRIIPTGSSASCGCGTLMANPFTFIFSVLPKITEWKSVVIEVTSSYHSCNGQEKREFSSQCCLTNPILNYKSEHDICFKSELYIKEREKRDRKVRLHLPA